MNSELPPEPGAGTDSPDQVAEVSADDAAMKSAEEVAMPKGTPKTAQRAKAKPKPVITTIEELLTFAYESNARLLEFSKDALKKLPVTDDGIAAQGELVASLAANDPTLATPYKLLQYAARQGVQLKRAEDGDLARALNRIVDLAVLALGHNPVFRVWMDQLLDPRRDPQLSTDHLRDEARRIGPDKLGLAPEQFKATDSDRLVKNAIACYGILRALQREWSLDQFIDAAYSSLWKYEAPEAIGLERAVGEIGASRDHDVLGIVSANFLARIARLDRQVAQQERDAASAWNREARLREELAAATEREQVALARAEAFSADVVRLQKELAAERDNRVVDKSHMADDYETLRTRIIRRLGGEIDLLTDGLHALRNGAPNVAEEFLDRSLLALSREVEQLKDAAGGLA
ncbi:hypothetical protein [Nocardioides daeguensis]|uniref:Uncharacterized protein n=1 Tax=Nocardioides daeguensis TaxID=908359 RepID=A0ABP6VPP3_9ACTN|nr:hypothetical protein [Nocardioides daeguensis]MBV6728533.1 hypothetical protein [Nocardioides daeguensis]MCR1773957.1 hypothetical protein [Nocardioides daeguensis]